MEKSGHELNLVGGVVSSLVAIAGTVLVLASLILCYKRYIDPQFLCEYYYTILYITENYIDTLQSLS